MGQRGDARPREGPMPCRMRSGFLSRSSHGAPRSRCRQPCRHGRLARTEVWMVEPAAELETPAERPGEPFLPSSSAGRSSCATAPGLWEARGTPAKTPVLMRDYGRARDYDKTGVAALSDDLDQCAAISLSRSACVSAELLRPRGRECAWVWLEKRSATRLIWIPSPMMLPSFPSVVPLAIPSCATRPKPSCCTRSCGRLVGKGEQMGADLSRGPENRALTDE